MSESTQRASCWSITINNPVEADYKCQLPAGWALEGQREIGENGTPHYQGMLCTPQVRFIAVKKIFPTVHIEAAKNKAALKKYVHKEDTRVATVPDNVSNIPTLFDFQHTIAAEFDLVEFDVFCESHQSAKPDTTDFVKSVAKQEAKKVDVDELAVLYVDKLVAKHIEAGVNGVEYIAVNPMWRGAWKKFWRSMVRRELAAQIKTSDQDIECPSAADLPPALNSSAENASLDL